MDKYSEELKSLLKRSEIEAFKCKSNNIDTICFLLAVLNSDCKLRLILNSYDITYNKIKKNIFKTSNNFIYLAFDNNFKRIIECAFNKNKEKNIDELNSLQLFLTILDNKKNKLTLLLKKYTPNINLIYKDIEKINVLDKNLLIYDIGTNLNEIVLSNDFNKVYNRENELNKIIEVLARKNKNNPLLIGDAGVGKTAIVEELTRKIIKKDVPDFLSNQIIISLNISSVIAGTKYRGEFEDKLNKIIRELENSKNIILFIDEMHTLIGAGGAEGAIDASNILKPVLARNNIKVIGATTINEYKKYIEKDKAFDRRFQKILVEEPDQNSVTNILIKIKKDYERFHNVKISNKCINEIVYLTNKYLFDKKEPDRSIDVLDEVCAYASINYYSNYNSNINKKINNLQNLKNKYIKNSEYEKATDTKKEIIELKKKLNNKNSVTITTSDIKKIIENKSNLKILDTLEEKKIILKIKESIIGQDDVINKLSEINFIRSLDNKPTSILLNGKNGVGKTMCAIEYAKALNLNLIRLDMNEYNNEMSLNKILGSPKGYVGYDDINNTFESLKFYPNSVILFDEIDKAHPKIISIIKSILNESVIKTNKNEELNFKNTIIFLTSNKDFKTEKIGFNSGLAIIEDNEFFNIANYSLNFKNLNLYEIKKIITNNLKEFNKEYKTNYKFSTKEINEIVKECEYSNYGAKKVNNIIKKHLEYKLIKI